MLYGYLISNKSHAKIVPLFIISRLVTSVESLYNGLQFLLRKLPTDEKGSPTYLIFGFW